MRISINILALTFINVLVFIITAQSFRSIEGYQNQFLLLLIMGGIANFLLIFVNILLFHYPKYKFYLLIFQLTIIAIQFGFVSIGSIFNYILVSINFLIYLLMEYKPFSRKISAKSDKANEIIRDIVCQVYAGKKSKVTIDAVLYEFLPNYIELNLDFASKMDDEGYIFKSEDEMVNYFIENLNVAQTFYWNKYINNPDKIMVGANILSDDTLVISLTIDGTQRMGLNYLDRLKHFLNSEMGVISYVNPVGYTTGEDFISICKNYNLRSNQKV